MIETERLALHPFQESDAEDAPAYLRSPAVHCCYRTNPALEGKV